MNDSTFLYQCPACGNTWGWTYLFVVRCQRCKAYSSFAEAAVSASEVPATAGNYEMRPVCTPAADVSVAGRPAPKANGGYSNGFWRLAGTVY